MNKKIKNLFRIKKGYFLVLLGFITVLLLEGILYLITTDDFLLRFKSETGHYTPELLGVNKDLNFYPNILLKKTNPDFSFFGYFFYFTLISMIYILIARKKEAFFLLAWFIVVLLYLQYGSMNLSEYLLMNRIGRFLNVLTIPTTLIIAYFLVHNKLPFKKIVIAIIVGILFVTSVYYIIKITTSLDQNMIDFRMAANYLKTQPKKNIYSDPDTIGKLDFLLAYKRTEYLKNIENVKDPDKINDSFVVVDASRGYVEVPQLRSTLPTFIWNPPENWKEVLVITESKLGIYGKYDTKIYYVS